MIITISGFHGTGKTTIAKKLAEKFNIRYISAGDIFRQMAKEKKMTLKQFSKYVEKHPEIDYEIDNRTIEEAQKGNVVLEGLLVAWKTRDLSAIHILLRAAEKVRIDRIAQREDLPYEGVKEDTLGREESEINRFKKLYDINLNDYSVYDIVLNTELWTEESIIQIVFLLIQENQKFVQKSN